MKEKKFIRSGLHLPVKDLKQTIQYYRETLGFYDEWTFGDKDGGIKRDEMRLLFGEDPSFVNDMNNSRLRLALMWIV
jgi:hypothetical protein